MTSAKADLALVVAPAVPYGLADRGGLGGSLGYPVAIVGERIGVANLSWAEWQSTQGGPLNSAKVASLTATIKAANAQGITINARPWVAAASDSPQFVQDAVGTWAWTDASGSGGGSTQVWKPAWAPLYADFITKLAAEFDGAFGAFGMTAGSGFYDEPFWLSQSSADQAQLVALGFTNAAWQATMEAGIDAHRAWKLTPTEMTFDVPWTYSGGKWAKDEAFMAAVFGYATSTLPRQIAGNHSMTATENLSAEPYPTLLGWWKAGGDVYIQTATAAKIGDLATTVQNCLAVGACWVELPSGVTPTPAQITQWTAALLANRH
jgi:hypothetical protein